MRDNLLRFSTGKTRRSWALISVEYHEIGRLESKVWRRTPAFISLLSAGEEENEIISLMNRSLGFVQFEHSMFFTYRRFVTLLTVEFTFFAHDRHCRRWNHVRGQFFVVHFLTNIDSTIEVTQRVYIGISTKCVSLDHQWSMTRLCDHRCEFSQSFETIDFFLSRFLLQTDVQTSIRFNEATKRYSHVWSSMDEYSCSQSITIFAHRRFFRLRSRSREEKRGCVYW